MIGKALVNVPQAQARSYLTKFLWIKTMSLLLIKPIKVPRFAGRLPSCCTPPSRQVLHVGRLMKPWYKCGKLVLGLIRAWIKPPMTHSRYCKLGAVRQMCERWRCYSNTLPKPSMPLVQRPMSKILPKRHWRSRQCAH